MCSQVEQDKATREEMKEEALKRMRAIAIYPPTVNQFEKNDIVSQSEMPLGAYYWVSDEVKAKIKEIENEYGGLVYSVIFSKTLIGDMYSMLWVTKEKNEWSMDWGDIQNNILMAYVWNKSDECCSEFGAIKFKMGLAGGLIRIL